MSCPDVIEVNSNMCQFGMKTKYEGKVGLVSKATKYLTNSPEVAKRLDKRCSQECKESQLHLPIWGARAKEAQCYPMELCKAVTAGILAGTRLAATNM